MDIFTVFFLGILQGVAEFLPISSSGHLIIFSEFLNVDMSAGELNSFIVFLHLGTLISILIYFRKLILETVTGVFKREEKYINLFINTIISTIPPFTLGVLFTIFVEPSIERSTQFYIASIALMIAGTVFILSDKIKPRAEIESMYSLNRIQALTIGAFQTFGIIFGVSRSGSTIIGSRYVGLSKKDSLDYAFFASIPLLLGVSFGSIVMELHGNGFNGSISYLLIGIIVSCISGLLSISFLINFLKKRSLRVFGIYCLVFGAVSFLIYHFL